MLSVVFFFVILWSDIHCFTEPLVIGHRGASGYRPEHSLASYELAMDMNADYIEFDLVSTKDHVLVCMHSLDLREVTDVENHEEFSHRERTVWLVNKNFTGFWVFDFTLEELKTLKLKQRFSFRNYGNITRDYLYDITTFNDALQLLQVKQLETSREFGLYIEIKWSSYFQSLGLSIEEPLIRILEDHKINKNNVFIQSFEHSNLRKLKEMGEYKLIQLIGDVDDDSMQDFGWMLTEDGFKKVSEYAYGIGPNKHLIFNDMENKGRDESAFIKRAHDANLKVHPWTFRSEKQYFNNSYFENMEQEVLFLFHLGVDGVFTDNPNVALSAKHKYLQGQSNPFLKHEVISQFVETEEDYSSNLLNPIAIVLVVIAGSASFGYYFICKTR